MFPNPQDALPLPARPNLEQYRKLAQSLLKACRAHRANPDAIDHWAEQWVNRLARTSGKNHTHFTELRIRRRIEGFADFIERQLIARGKTNKTCTLAGAQLVMARSHGVAGWPQLVKHIQSLAKASSPGRDFESAADAVVNGDLATLKRLLRRHPDLARKRSAREHNATLLHYVSANGVENYRQRSPTNAVEIARTLLDAGSEVDAEADVYGGGSTTLGLVATSVHPRDAGVQLELLDLLLQRGAAIEHPRAGGNKSVAVRACLDNGQPRAAEFLAERGARLDLVAAAGVGRLEQMRAYFLPDGTPCRGITRQQMGAALRYASGYGRKEAVEFLLNKDVDLPAHSGDGQTALHYAAIFGKLEMVKLLLAHNAPLEVENEYGGTVLGQTLWSAAHGGDPTIYAQIIETLIAAGARVPDRHVPVNTQIDALLERYGSRPEPDWHWFGEEPRRARKKARRLLK
jgi:ankyrin repeat protein